MSGVGKAVGGAFKPQVTTQDPNNPMLKGLQGSQTNYLQGLFQNGGGLPGASGLQTQTQSMLGQAPAGSTLERDTFGQLQGALGGMLRPQSMGMPQQSFTGAGLPGAWNGGFNFIPQGYGMAPTGSLGDFKQQMQLTPAMAGNTVMPELRSPYGAMGAMNPAYQQLAAMQPIFQRNLASANATLGAQAPGRFSSAFVREGTDLNSQALQDYNLFAAQALQQGQQLQLAERQANMNFMLGARGISQGAATAQGEQGLRAAEINANSALQARSLAQQAAGLEGQLGIDAFNATAGAGNAQQQMLLQALLGQQSNQLQARGQDITGLANLWQSQLGADQNMQNWMLGSQGLMQQGMLGAGGLLGQMAGSVGQNEFTRLAQSAQLGMQATELMQNPILQMMLASMQYAQPQALNHVVGGSVASGIGDLLGGVGAIFNPFKRGGG